MNREHACEQSSADVRGHAVALKEDLAKHELELRDMQALERCQGLVSEASWQSIVASNMATCVAKIVARSWRKLLRALWLG